MTTVAEAEGSKGYAIGDAVPYALGQGIRIEIISILNECAASETQIARRLGLTQSKVHHHMIELLKRGSIEQIPGREVGNVTERLYRALKTSEYSVEDYRRMNEDDRHLTMGVTLQNATAEHLAAFRAGEMAGDNPNVVMLWAWFVLDEEGKAEMTAELEANWKRMKEIEARSADRRTRSKDDGQSVIVSSIAHRRVRPAPEDKALRALTGPDELS
jgi:DNA-binding transcriptional ArsR family regulator